MGFYGIKDMDAFCQDSDESGTIISPKKKLKDRPPTPTRLRLRYRKQPRTQPNYTSIVQDRKSVV